MEREQLKITKLKSPGMPDTVPACSLAQAPSRPNGSSPLGHPSSTSSSTQCTPNALVHISGQGKLRSIFSEV